MNILIKNIPNTYNYGSMMMAENIISYLNKYAKIKINYFTEAQSEEDILRLKNNVNIFSGMALARFETSPIILLP